MWIFTRYGFYSVSFQKNRMAVRARVRRHLERLVERFPEELQGTGIAVSDHADYRYRIHADRENWVRVVRALAEEQTWGNFKSEVGRFQGYDGYERALHEVWATMMKLQRDEKEERAR